MSDNLTKLDDDTRGRLQFMSTRFGELLSILAGRPIGFIFAFFPSPGNDGKDGRVSAQVTAVSNVDPGNSSALLRDLAKAVDEHGVIPEGSGFETFVPQGKPN